ncbi:MAG: glycosyltransferase [Acidobacteriota bacterium]|nr:glycosyltransferase [Acidobacteriota bacterium]
MTVADSTSLASTRPARSPAGHPLIGGPLGGGAPERRAAIGERVETLLTVLGASLPRPAPNDDRGRPADDYTLAGLGEKLDAVVARLSVGPPEESWLALAVISGRLPTVAPVQRLHRASRLGDGLRSLSTEVKALWVRDRLDLSVWPEVEVVSDVVVVDLHHTASNVVATGIQRVAREAGRRWDRDHDIIAIGWTPTFGALRRLSVEERQVALEGLPYADSPGEPSGPRSGRAPGECDADDQPEIPVATLVPWRCTHLVAELPAEIDRGERYRAFVEFSRCRTGLVGHDCVPITASETTSLDMAFGFTSYLAAAAAVDRVAATSASSAAEYEGWREMLSGSGRAGPEIRRIGLAVEAEPSDPDSLDAARGLLSVGSLPIVLSVGSHEPRKNHEALLHAAELAWREGVEFTLTFVGGNSWSSGRFYRRVGELQEEGRALQVIQGLSDHLLWAAYRVAHCTVFPSLHEGFGLPVAESLACGTPVITASYGTMAELCTHGGALLIDPRDDHDMKRALVRMITEPGLRSRLAAEAAATPVRTWDDYAVDTWSFLVEEPLQPRSLHSAPPDAADYDPRWPGGTR